LLWYYREYCKNIFTHSHCRWSGGEMCDFDIGALTRTFLLCRFSKVCVKRSWAFVIYDFILICISYFFNAQLVDDLINNSYILWHYNNIIIELSSHIRYLCLRLAYILWTWLRVILRCFLIRTVYEDFDDDVHQRLYWHLWMYWCSISIHDIINHSKSSNLRIFETYMQKKYIL